jgi:hypothetical protein
MADPLGFQPILDRWRTSGRHEQAEHVAAVLKTFEWQRTAVYRNLDTDRQISQARRESLLEQLKFVDSSNERVVVETVVGYCWSNKGRGRANKTAQKAALGHVVMRETFKDNLSASHAGKSLLTGSLDADLFVGKLLRRDLAAQKSLLTPPGTELLLRPRLMWSLYQSRALNQPFRNVDTTRDELTRRLGLGHLPKPPDPLLFWEHRLHAHQTACRPTAFDAAENEFFRPGGKTKPLRGRDGLHEVVHPPIAATQLTARIQQAS